LTKYEALRKSGHGIAIDGPAHRLARIGLHASAWRDPARSHLRDATRGAPFHAAWDLSLTGAKTNTPATKFLWSHYPDAVRRWIARHGGLKSQTIYLGGHELAAMFPTCR
jgi:hypothetical protein